MIFTIEKLMRTSWQRNWQNIFIHYYSNFQNLNAMRFVTK